MRHVLVYGMTDNPGGIEAYVHNLFERVQGNGVMLDFVSDFPAISGGERLQAKGAKLHFIPAKGRDLLGHLRGMWRVLRAHPEYKTVYFNILDAGAAVTMLPAFLLGRKIVTHSHNNDTDKPRLHKLTKPFLNLINRGRAACSEAAAVHMFGKKSGDTLVIPNAIDSAAFTFDPAVRAKVREELGLGDSLVLGHVGRISLQKNPLFLVDVLKAVCERHPDTLLLSVGDGEMAAEFEEYIEKQGMGERVRRLGVRNDTPSLLQAMDVFLFPSVFEGLGIALLEAQAAGLPCVISDVIPKAATVTDLVCPLPLDGDTARWADAVLACKDTERTDTRADLAAAGYDIHCCEQWDKRLLAMF